MSSCSTSNLVNKAAWFIYWSHEYNSVINEVSGWKTTDLTVFPISTIILKIYTILNWTLFSRIAHWNPIFRYHFGHHFYCPQVPANFISRFYVKFKALQCGLKISCEQEWDKFQISKIEKIFVIFGRILGKKIFQDHQIIFQVELPQSTCNPRENYLIPEWPFLTVFSPVEMLIIADNLSGLP